ncbi:putative Cytochrome b-c1 complex subunit 2, mitochondrial [Hypsibius exemplaris]|uniref:Cytochrome b-c1 complex subunit 2, mitochondrial n=1 Tax=Hypsibius exemplaris TaxID=2072580 RepID=A0A1W0WN45_HYPEX|nr:putative Cytochrome b-c1 complex subunit 2, mitochondrial [Hypsibius exemplaris]
MLSDYAQRVFKPNRVVISGGNVGHDELLSLAQKYFKFDNGGEQDTGVILTSKIPGVEVAFKPDASANDKPAKYVGGEIHEDSVDQLAYAAFVTEGPGLNKPKDLITMQLVQQVIGVEPHIKWSAGQNASELSKAAAGVAQNPFAVSGVAFCHADSSLSGFSVVSHAKDLPNILKAGLEVLRGKSGVDEKRLQAAKNRLISSILMAHESSADSVLDAAVQASASGNVLSANEAIKIVEKVSLSEIIALAKKSLSSKPTLAAVGNLSHCPRLDELVAK